MVMVICHSFNTLTSSNFLFNCRCLLTNNSYLRCMVSIISAPQLGTVTWVTSLLTNKTCWAVFPEPKHSTPDNLVDEVFSFPLKTRWP